MSQSHKVFISWSGTLSNEIAKAVRDWISVVIQSSNPFMSQADIAPGARGMTRIASELKDIKIGLFCVTSENQDSKWLNFEAGAISKIVEEAHVIPILFDLEKGQLTHPLAQFQAVQISREEMKKVAETINMNVLSPGPLNAETLDRAFELAWAGFEQAVEKIRVRHLQTPLPGKPSRSTNDMFEEIVVTLRDQSAAIEEIQRRERPPEIVNEQISLTMATIKRIFYGRKLKDRATVPSLAALAPQLTNAEWQIVAEAPFLRWYMEKYFDAYREKYLFERWSDGDSGEARIDDVPF